jgi:hypothetical protein
VRLVAQGVGRLVVGRGLSLLMPSVALALAALLGGAACSGSPSPRPSTAPPPPTRAQLAEAKRLIDPDNEPEQPTATEIACVVQVVVKNPALDELANDMAQLANGDLRQAVMTAYLECAYNYILDIYIRFAPAALSQTELACIRSKFTQLDVARLAEVIVQDPDAGYTGPLVIQACSSGSTENPLLHGTIPNVGGG